MGISVLGFRAFSVACFGVLGLELAVGILKNQLGDQGLGFGVSEAGCIYEGIHGLGQTR